MIFSQLLKPGFKSILFTSLITLQMAIVLDASANSGKKPNTDTNTNHKAVIRGTDSGSVTEDNDPDGDNLLEVGAKLRVKDRDKDEAAFIPTTIYGNYGSLTIDTDGYWSYAADNNQTVIQNLTNNTTLTDNLTVSSIDGTTHNVAIVIMGADEIITPPTPNNPAIISGVDSGSITEDIDPDGDNLLEVGGYLNITDSDAGEAAFVAKTLNGNYGSLTINTAGYWNYAANNSQTNVQSLSYGATLTESLTISSVDGTTHTIEITIMGADEANQTDLLTNQVAMYSYNANLSDAQALSGAVLEQTTVYMFFNSTSQYSSMSFYCCKGIDGASTGEAHKAAVRDSSAPFVYSVDLSQYSTAGTRELYVDRTRTDGSGIDNIFVNFSINIRIIPITPTPEPTPNSPAIISGDSTGSVTEDVDPDGDNLLEVGGKLNITDSDSGEAAFVAKTLNGNYGSLTIDAAGNWNYAANNSQSIIQNLASSATLTDSLTVSSIDGTTHNVVITITGVDDILANVSLSWVAPAEREDNTALSLSEIASYKIYYSSTQGQYTNSVAINDSTATGHTFTSFSSGTYYFVITTIDTDGRESQHSAEVKKII